MNLPKRRSASDAYIRIRIGNENNTVDNTEIIEILLNSKIEKIRVQEIAKNDAITDDMQ
jgi:hypothetical protein